MPVVNYHSANGRLIGETTSEVRTDYMSDALGSVTGTLNASQAVVNTYRYKPYGELLAKTGSAADPAFMWNGTTQSRRTGLTYSDQYNRARHYGTRQGQWTTVDPLWPRERPYGYCLGNATTNVDPSGDVSVSVNSFIHKDQDYSAKTVKQCNGVSSGGWIKAPFNPSGLAYYRGDQRDFMRGDSKKTSRVHSTVTYDNCSIGSLGLGSLNVGSDRTQGLMVTSVGVWGQCLEYRNPFPKPIVKDHLVINLGRSERSGSSVVLFRYSANDPLVLGSPSLWANVMIYLNMDFCEGKLDVRTQIAHTTYPWLEAYAKTGERENWLIKYKAKVDDLVLGLISSTVSSGSTSFSVEPCKKCCKL